MKLNIKLQDREKRLSKRVFENRLEKIKDEYSVLVDNFFKLLSAHTDIDIPDILIHNIKAYDKEGFFVYMLSEHCSMSLKKKIKIVKKTYPMYLPLLLKYEFNVYNDDHIDTVRYIISTSIDIVQMLFPDTDKIDKFIQDMEEFINISYLEIHPSDYYDALKGTIKYLKQEYGKNKNN